MFLGKENTANAVGESSFSFIFKHSLFMLLSKSKLLLILYLFHYTFVFVFFLYFEQNLSKIPWPAEIFSRKPDPRNRLCKYCICLVY